MMRFLIGVVVGVVGYWAYEQSLLPRPWSSETSTESYGGSSAIVRPTPQEVAGRPSEPIPS